MVVPAPPVSLDATGQPVRPASPLEWEPIASRHPGAFGWLRWALPLAFTFLLLFGAFFVQLPYYALSPGSTYPVATLVSAPPEHLHPPNGRLLVSTVALQSRVTPFEAFVSWYRTDEDLIEEELITGGRSPGEKREADLQQMTDSKLVATVVALRRLGMPVVQKGTGALVLEVTEGTPAADHLEAGDTVVAVDGRPIQLGTDLVTAIRDHRPGDTIRLDVQRDGAEPRVEEVALIENPNEGMAGTAFLGVRPGTRNLDFQFPFALDINSLQVGGPSAGAAFTLGLIDVLTPGELTGGQTIAVTGTIDASGTIGPIGGVGQKASAVASDGATVFLVPTANYAEAYRRAPDGLRIVPIANLEQALEALRALGGDLGAVPPAPPQPAP